MSDQTAREWIESKSWYPPISGGLTGCEKVVLLSDALEYGERIRIEVKGAEIENIYSVFGEILGTCTSPLDGIKDHIELPQGILEDIESVHSRLLDLGIDIRARRAEQ